MTCGACGEKPTHTTKDFTKAVIEIDNPEQIALLRKVSIPASMGDETSVPPAIGKYRNVILYYEVNKHIYLYSSDGIPTLLETAELPQDILDRIASLEDYDVTLTNRIQGDEEAIATKQDELTPGENISIEEESGALVISAQDTTYTAGNGLNLNGTEFSVDTVTIATQQDLTDGLAEKQDELTPGDNISIEDESGALTISAVDTTYTAGNGLNLNGTEFSADTTTLATQTDLSNGLATKQDTLTAGDNITIEDESGALVISAATQQQADWGQSDSSAVDYIKNKPSIPTKTSDLVNDGSDGSHSYIDTTTFEANSNNQSIRGGYGAGSLSQFGAVSLGDAASASKANAIAIGARAHSYGSGSIAIGSAYTGAGTMPVANYNYGIAIGYNSRAGISTSGEQAQYSVALGAYSQAGGPRDVKYSVAIGAYSNATEKGQVDISTTSNGGTASTYGYNNSPYRLLTGLYDPQSAHDAATKGYVDPTTDASAPTASTVGRLGQLQIDTTNGDAYICVAADDSIPTYTWKKITP